MGVASVAVTILAGLGLAPRSSAAPSRWVEVTSPGFVVITDTSPDRAQDVARDLERAREAFHTLWPWALPREPRPLVVFLLETELAMRSLAPEYWEQGARGAGRARGAWTVWAAGEVGHFVALRLDTPPEDDRRVTAPSFAYQGYAASALMNALPPSPPRWLARGVVEVFANTLVHGDRVAVGRPRPQHMETLAGSLPIPVAELTRDPLAPGGWDLGRVGASEAEAWLLVHYLSFGDGGRHRQRLTAFADHLLSGAPPEAKAAGLGELALEAALLAHLRGGTPGYESLVIDLHDHAPRYAVRSLPIAEVAALRAGFHLAMERYDEARAALSEAALADPDCLRAVEVRAFLSRADAAGGRATKEEALAAFRRAADAGSRDPVIHRERASLLVQLHPSPDAETLEEIAQALAQAVAVAPRNPWCQGTLAWALLHLGRPEQAVASAREAVALEAGVLSHRWRLIDVLWHAGRLDEARGALIEAEPLASGDEAQAPLARWRGLLQSPEERRSVRDENDDSGKRAPSVDVARLEAVCAVGGTRACAHLAQLKLEGRDVPLDLEGARELADRACGDEVTAACVMLAAAHFRLGDVERARTLLQGLCDSGVAQACELLAKLPTP